MKTIQELVPLIQEWAKERGIFDKSTPFDQLLKTHEEVGELIKRVMTMTSQLSKMR